jgi:chromosomal replication initiation ATPase DnaA
MKQDIFNRYAEILADRFGIEKQEIFTKVKKRECVDARQLLYYLCSKRPMRIKYIQEYMAKNGYTISHSTVIHGIKQIKERLEVDKDYVSIIKSIENSVNL